MQQLSLEVALVKAQMQETHEKKKGKKEAGKKGKDSRASESESNALATENMGDEESRASESESNALATENRGDEGNKSPEAGLGKTRVLIVASESDVFCAGADLKERAMMTNLQSVCSVLGEISSLVLCGLSSGGCMFGYSRCRNYWNTRPFPFTLPLPRVLYLPTVVTTLIPVE